MVLQTSCGFRNTLKASECSHTQSVRIKTNEICHLFFVIIIFFDKLIDLTGKWYNKCPFLVCHEWLLV